MRIQILIFFLFITVKNFSQEVAFTYLTDDTLFAFNSDFECKQYFDTVVIDNEVDYVTWKNSCSWDIEKPDFSKFIILGGYYGGDCHMRLEPHVYQNDSLKTITLYTKNIWGGCRAGGWRELWILIPKPPQGYSLIFTEVQID